MAGDLVLITGATGHLGFRVLRYALEYGYKVRAAVRSEAKADIIRSNSALKGMNKSDNLSFIVVPDILAAGAYDKATDGVKYVIHVASPIPLSDSPSEDLERHFIRPAVQGTLGMFESARKAGTVSRIVVTSSVVAIVPQGALRAPSGETYTADSRLPTDEGPYANSFHAYGASKIAAFNRAEEWMKREKPAFDAIHVHPSYIVGRDDLVDSTGPFQTGTNFLPLNIALGRPAPVPVGNQYNSVNDTARVHVLSLDDKIEGNQSFICSTSGSDGFDWNDTRAIVEKHFPAEIKAGILPNNATYQNVVCMLDIAKTGEAFGFKNEAYEPLAVGVIGHWLELYKKEQEGVKN